MRDNRDGPEGVSASWELFAGKMDFLDPRPYWLPAELSALSHFLLQMKISMMLLYRELKSAGYENHVQIAVISWFKFEVLPSRPSSKPSNILVPGAPLSFRDQWQSLLSINWRENTFMMSAHIFCVLAQSVVSWWFRVCFLSFYLIYLISVVFTLY